MAAGGRHGSSGHVLNARWGALDAQNSSDAPEYETGKILVVKFQKA